MLKYSQRKRGDFKKMEFNFRKLKGRIIGEYGTVGNFAKEYGVSTQTISAKLNNKSKFTPDDIVKMSNMLHIDKDDIGYYFFDL